jgi:hypothetical protein
MRRCVALALALLPAIAARAAQKPTPHTKASVKLWLDTGTGNACGQSTPASGDWMIRNNEERNVLVIIHRTTTKAGVSKEDDMRDTLGPRELRDLGCEVSDNERQTLTLVRAVF